MGMHRLDPYIYDPDGERVAMRVTPMSQLDRRVRVWQASKVYRMSTGRWRQAGDAGRVLGGDLRTASAVCAAIVRAMGFRPDFLAVPDVSTEQQV